MTPAHKIALITGGSRGLGRNTALHLAERGVDVILTYNRQAEDAAAAVAEIEQRGARGTALQLDVAAAQASPPSPPRSRPG